MRLYTVIKLIQILFLPEKCHGMQQPISNHVAQDIHQNFDLKIIQEEDLIIYWFHLNGFQ